MFFNFLVGLIALVLTVICSIFFGWILYGFGELIENTASTVRAIDKLSVLLTEDDRPLLVNEWRCSCGAIHQNYVTSCHCGKTQREVFVEKNNK